MTERYTNPDTRTPTQKFKLFRSLNIQMIARLANNQERVTGQEQEGLRLANAHQAIINGQKTDWDVQAEMGDVPPATTLVNFRLREGKPRA